MSHCSVAFLFSPTQDKCGLLFPGYDPLFSPPCSSKLCNQAAETYLKDLPIYLPHTLKKKNKGWVRDYLSAIQVSLFCSLSEIYPVHKYHEISWEKQYLIYKRHPTVLISHWGELGVKQVHNGCAQILSRMRPKIGLRCFLCLPQEAVIFITPNNLNKNIQISSQVSGSGKATRQKLILCFLNAVASEEFANPEALSALFPPQINYPFQ